MNAVVVVDKPAGLTSHDVVNRIRRIFGQRSVGHVGTLDPAATGVLVLVMGSWTRLSQFYNDAEKEYEGVIRLGFSTNTYDAEGDATSDPQVVKVTVEEIRAAACQFIGSIEQMPPQFSAKKIQGVPAYKLARQEKRVELKAVEVQVHEFEILSLAADRVNFRARVGSGTYLRSIAHDLGQVLGCGGHLESLRRTVLGEYSVADAYTLEKMEEAKAAGTLEQMQIHPRRILPQFPCVTANEEQGARIRSGRSTNLPQMSQAKLVKVFAGQTDLICIASRIAGTLFHPKIVLAPQASPQAVTIPEDVRT